MKNLIIFYVLISFPLAFAAKFECIGKGRTVAPNPITSEWRDIHPDWGMRQRWSCCENLVLNKATRVCEDHSLVDVRFKFCRNHSECQESLTGCYPQHTSELYTTESLDPVEVAQWKKLRAIFDKQQATLERPEKMLGEFCYRNMECQSYQCENFKCNPQNICRHSHEGEVMPAPYMKRFLHLLPAPSAVAP